MKLALIVAVAALLPFARVAPAPDPNPDEKAVRKVLEQYIHAAKTCKVADFEKCFALEGGHIKRVRRSEDGTAYVKASPIREAIRSWCKRPPEPSSGRILSVDVVDGKVATAKVELLFRGYDYVDLFSLYKVGDEWKIVTKVYSSRGKAK